MANWKKLGLKLAIPTVVLAAYVVIKVCFGSAQAEIAVSDAISDLKSKLGENNFLDGVSIQAVSKPSKLKGIFKY